MRVVPAPLPRVQGQSEGLAVTHPHGGQKKIQALPVTHDGLHQEDRLVRPAPPHHAVTVLLSPNTRGTSSMTTWSCPIPTRGTDGLHDQLHQVLLVSLGRVF